MCYGSCHQETAARAHALGRVYTLTRRAGSSAAHTQVRGSQPAANRDRAPAMSRAAPAPSRQAVGTARVVFRENARPLQQPSEEDKAAQPDVTKLQLCMGSSWRECKQDSCGCKAVCAKFRLKTGWPASLPCVDPNNKDTSVDAKWATEFLQFAERSGWYKPDVPNSHPARQALPSGL